MASSRPVVNVAVDWANNGNFTDSGDDVSGRVLQRDTAQAAYGRDRARTLSPVSPGQASFSLSNTSRDYSPDNAGSPLAGKLVPGRPVRIQAVQDATTFVLYRGFTDGYTVLPNRQDRSVQFTCLDALARFTGVTLSTALYQGVRTGTAAGYILDAMGWPGGARDLDTGATYLRWWWEEGTDALTALQKLIGAEGPPAIAFVDTNGNFVFRDRTHRLLRAASTTVQATFSNGGVPDSAGGNLIPAADADFETALTGNWIIWADVTSLARDTVNFFTGAASLKITATAAGTAQIIYNPAVAAFDGQPLVFTCEIKSPVSTTMNITIFWSTAGGGGNGSTTIGANLVNGWNAYSSGVLYPPAGTAKGQAWLTIAATGSAQVFNLDTAAWTTVPAATYSQPSAYDAGWRDIVNTVQVACPERNTAGALQVVWQDNGAATYAIPASGTLVLTVQGSDPFTGAITPTAGTDFTLLSGTATAALNRTSGQAVTITLTDSGSGSAVTGLQLRAYPVQVTQTTQVSSVDATSQTAYGVRGLPAGTDMSWCSPQDAAAVAALITGRYAQRRPIVTLPLFNATGVRLTQQLSRDLSDRVHVIDSDTGIDADCFLERIEYTIGEAGRIVQAMFGCEKAPTDSANAPANVFILDDAAAGKLDTGGTLGT